MSLLISEWSWAVLFAPIIALYSSKAEKSDVTELKEDVVRLTCSMESKAGKEDVQALKEDVTHISSRVDQIYAHLLDVKEKLDGHKL